MLFLLLYNLFVVAGETETVDVVAPVFQAYDVAPEAVKFAVAPEHIVALFAATVGAAPTTKCLGNRA